MRWVCSKCGGDSVEWVAWVNANTHEYITEYGADGDTDMQWCNSCQKHTEIIREEEYGQHEDGPVEMDDDSQ